MTEPNTSEEIAGGVLGKVAGKVKEAAGSLTGKDELAREGRLQQAQVDAEAQAERELAEARQREARSEVEAAKTANQIERERLGTQVAAEDNEAAIEDDRERAEHVAELKAQEAKRAAVAQRAAEESRATAAEQRAESERREVADATLRLEQEARRAETRADTVDPEKGS